MDGRQQQMHDHEGAEFIGNHGLFLEGLVTHPWYPAVESDGLVVGRDRGPALNAGGQDSYFDKGPHTAQDHAAMISRTTARAADPL